MELSNSQLGEFRGVGSVELVGCLNVRSEMILTSIFPRTIAVSIRCYFGVSSLIDELLPMQGQHRGHWHGNIHRATVSSLQSEVFPSKTDSIPARFFTYRIWRCQSYRCFPRSVLTSKKLANETMSWLDSSYANISWPPTQFSNNPVPGHLGNCSIWVRSEYAPPVSCVYLMADSRL